MKKCLHSVFFGRPLGQIFVLTPTRNGSRLPKGGQACSRLPPSRHVSVPTVPSAPPPPLLAPPLPLPGPGADSFAGREIARQFGIRYSPYLEEPPRETSTASQIVDRAHIQREREREREGGDNGMLFFKKGKISLPECLKAKNKNGQEFWKSASLVSMDFAAADSLSSLLFHLYLTFSNSKIWRGYSKKVKIKTVWNSFKH